VITVKTGKACCKENSDEHKKEDNAHNNSNKNTLEPFIPVILLQ
jgi:hypothetical protein